MKCHWSSNLLLADSFSEHCTKYEAFFEDLYIHANPPFSAKDSIKFIKYILRDQIIEHVSDYTIRGHPFMIHLWLHTEGERGVEGWGGEEGWKRGRFNIWTDADV